MSFFQYYFDNILKQEFVTKNIYRNIYEVPQLDRVVLSFTVSQTSLKSLLPLVSALTLISSQRPRITTSKRINILLRVKSGLPTGCRVDLRGKCKFIFFEKLVFSILPRIKEFSISYRNNIVFISIANLFVFKEIEKDYEYFSDLPKLNLNMIFRARSRLEVWDFLTVFRFPCSKAKDF